MIDIIFQWICLHCAIAVKCRVFYIFRNIVFFSNILNVLLDPFYLSGDQLIADFLHGSAIILEKEFNGIFIVIIRMYFK